jgi:hypothetical protein
LIIDLSDSEYDRVNREFDRLIALANDRIDEYNNIYLVQFNEQIADFNNELSIADSMSNQYPEEIFYVEEYSINPNNVFTIKPPLFAPITIPKYPFITPPVIYTNADSFLSALADIINGDDSYYQISKPDRNQFKSDRITDKNFVVDDYKIKW